MTSSEDALSSIFQGYAQYGKTPQQLKSQKVPEIDGRTLMKLAKQAKLINDKLKSTDVDLIFAKCKSKGKRTIDYHQFESVITEFAKKRGEDQGVIRETIIKSGAPKSNATVAEKVKFHDDKSLYTGTWKNGMFYTN